MLGEISPQRKKHIGSFGYRPVLCRSRCRRDRGNVTAARRGPSEAWDVYASAQRPGTRMDLAGCKHEGSAGDWTGVTRVATGR